MKLGIVADEIDRDFRAAVAAGKKLGINNFEIRFLKSGRAPMCDANELREVKQISDGEGVRITNFSPGLFKYTIDETGFRREMDELFPRVVETAKNWNLASVTVFGFAKTGAKDDDGDLFSSDNPPSRIFDWFTEVCDQAARENLTLLIEPEPISWADTFEATTAIIKKVGASNLKINYDAANTAWQNRADNAEEILGAVDLVKNVHVKDQKHNARGSGFPTWLEVGKGEIDYKRRFEILRTNDYNGVISLEPHFTFDLASFARCRDAVLRLWNEAGENLTVPLRVYTDER